MTRSLRFSLALGALTLLPASPSFTASAPPPAAARLESFDLAQLKDGETRSFGSPERSVSATRRGDVVEIALPDSPDGARSIQCTIGKDSCQVLAHERNGARTMLFVGADDKDASWLGSFRETEGEGEDSLVIVRKGDGGSHDVTIEGGPGRHVKVVRIGHPGDDARLLRCPEGDTTMTLGKEEAAGGYRCPKHGVALEESKAGQGPRMVKKIVVETVEKPR